MARVVLKLRHAKKETNLCHFLYEFFWSVKIFKPFFKFERDLIYEWALYNSVKT
jgi:hypothetical protein